MFKAIKDDKIIAINDSGEFPCLVHDSVEEDTEHQLSDYIHCDGQFVLTSSDEAIEQKKAQVRTVRDKYMQNTQNRIDRYRNQKELGIETTDAEEVFKRLLDYTQYLRDYPSGKNWWVKNPMVFDAWTVSVSELSV